MVAHQIIKNDKKTEKHNLSFLPLPQSREHIQSIAWGLTEYLPKLGTRISKINCCLAKYYGAL